MLDSQHVFNILAAVVGGLISLLFSYVPGLRTWYAGLGEDYKRLVMLGAVAVSTLLVLASSCLNLWPVIACERQGFLQLAEAFFLTLIANQTTYLITPQPADVRSIKAAKRKVT